jgi:hypothetical protein
MFPRQNKAIKSLMDSKSKTSRRTSQRDIIFVDKEEEEEEDEENAIIRLLNPRKLSASHI